MSKNIKILNILTGGIRREGISSTQLEFMRKMDLSDIQMDLAAVHDNDSKVLDDFEYLGCNTIILPDRQDKLIKYIVALYRLMKYEKYDIIHVHGSSSLMAIELVTAWLSGVKVRIAHSRNTRCSNKKAHKLLQPIFQYSYNVALSCGRDAGKWLFKDKPFIVIHNGKDLNKFRYKKEVRDHIRSQYNLMHKKVIGFVGNINNQKNVSFLIDVFKEVNDKMKDSVLFIIGDGPNYKDIENKVKKLGLIDSVIFTGAISNAQEMIQAMDIMCLPSIYEGLPNVVLEWQIAGLPCFISDKITNECKVTDLVQFLPINKGSRVWSEQLLRENFNKNREEASKDACCRMKEEMFDIEEGAKYLKKLYIDAVKGNLK